MKKPGCLEMNQKAPVCCVTMLILVYARSRSGLCRPRLLADVYSALAKHIARSEGIRFARRIRFAYLRCPPRGITGVQASDAGRLDRSAPATTFEG